VVVDSHRSTLELIEYFLESLEPTKYAYIICLLSNQNQRNLNVMKRLQLVSRNLKFNEINVHRVYDIISTRGVSDSQPHVIEEFWICVDFNGIRRILTLFLWVE